MTDEYNRAVDRIRDEMAGSKSAYVRVVGEYLTEYLGTHPEAAGAILAEGVTIKGSLEAVKAEARKHSEGGVGVVDDETAFGIVREYYGIRPAPAARTAAKPQAPAEDPDLDLDSLLASGPAGLSPSESQMSPGETRAPAEAEGAGREGEM